MNMSKQNLIELLLNEEKIDHVVLTLVNNQKIAVDKISYDIVGKGLIIIESPTFIAIDENSIVSIQPIYEIDYETLKQI